MFNTAVEVAQVLAKVVTISKVPRSVIIKATRIIPPKEIKDKAAYFKIG